VGSHLAHEPKIYPKAHENHRAFSCISSTIFLESFIQCPWEGGKIASSPPLEKDLTSNPEVLETLGFFP